MQTISLLCNRLEGHGAQVLHFFVTGGGVVAVTAARKPADLGPLPLLSSKLSVDALQLLFRAVAIQAGMEKSSDLAALVLLVLELVGGQRGQGTIPSSLWWEEREREMTEQISISCHEMGLISPDPFSLLPPKKTSELFSTFSSQKKCLC